MQIRSTHSPMPPLSPFPKGVAATPPEALPSVDTFEPGWLAAGVSVAGGVTALVGGLSRIPLVVAAGCALTALGTAGTAHDLTSGRSHNDAAWVSLAAGGALTAAGALLLTHQPAGNFGPQGPLPQLVRQLGARI